jgi:hypothetical protein
MATNEVSYYTVSIPKSLIENIVGFFVFCVVTSLTFYITNSFIYSVLVLSSFFAFCVVFATKNEVEKLQKDVENLKKEIVILQKGRRRSPNDDD